MKELHLYQNGTGSVPLVYLNVFEGNGSDVWKECQKLNAPPFALAVISGLAWDEELSPWAAEPVFKDNNFAGRADGYLAELTTQLAPQVRGRLNTPPLWEALAGYSMAGLFAVYAAYNTDMFRAVASASGSLWYPNFTRYMQINAPSEALECAYFSLGDREHKTKNAVMASVKECTQQAQEILAGKGVRTCFELNEGNHFMAPAWRTARGIVWVLQNVGRSVYTL